MSRITSVDVEPLYDSRGRSTVEATVVLDSRARGRAGAPSGASTGRHEVRAFPREECPRRWRPRARSSLPPFVGLDSADQGAVDRALHEVDGTPDFARIGGNTATAISIASAMAYGEETHAPLWKVVARPGVDGHAFPAIVGNCMNGGRARDRGAGHSGVHRLRRGPRPPSVGRAPRSASTE